MKLLSVAVILLVLGALIQARSDSYTIGLSLPDNGRLVVNHLDAVGMSSFPRETVTNTVEVILTPDFYANDGFLAWGGCVLWLPRSSSGERQSLVFAPGQVVSNDYPTIGFFASQHWSRNRLDEIGAGWDWPNMNMSPGDGFVEFHRVYYRTNFTFKGTARTPSGRHVSIPAGGAFLLGAETVTNGTYEIVVGDSPVEGSEVWRLNPNGNPLHFGPPDYTVHTYQNGVWSPQVPVLDIGEAAWFRAPPPALSLNISNGNALVSWTTNSIPFALESSTVANLGAWMSVTNSAATNGVMQTVAVPLAAGESRLFRLRH
jgi:hypothetical protein